MVWLIIYNTMSGEVKEQILSSNFCLSDKIIIKLRPCYARSTHLNKNVFEECPVFSILIQKKESVFCTNWPINLPNSVTEALFYAIMNGEAHHP